MKRPPRVRHLRRAYLNPNVQPEQLYSAIKKLALLYPQIVVWSPVVSRLDAAGFALDEFLSAIAPEAGGPPAVVPAGRDEWFRRDWRRSHVDPEARLFDQAFEARIHAAAASSDTILPLTDVEIGYAVVDDLYSETSSGRERVDELGGQILRGLPPSMIVRIEDVAERRGRSPGWALANAIAQDIRATHRLRGENYTTASSIAIGFGLFEHRHERRLDTQPPPIPKSSNDEIGVDPSELIEFLSPLLREPDLPWSEVVIARRDRGPAIWEMVRRYSEQRIPGDTLLRHAQQTADGMHRRAREATRFGVAGTFGAIGLLAAGPAAAGLFAAGGTALTILLRQEMRLRRMVARRLASGHERFLVDSPFFASAERRET